MTSKNTAATLAAPPLSASTHRSLEEIGDKINHIAGFVLRYGLVGILLYYGLFKFYPFEAKSIQPLISHSPFMSWLYNFLSVSAASKLIGTTEILIALGIAIRPIAPKITALASLGAVGMTLTTLSFLFSTPGAWTHMAGVPLPVTSATGSFLLKDVFLLGAALWSLGESLRSKSKEPLPF